MPETIAEQIRSALVKSGVSQYKFAVSAGVNPQTVSRFLSGQTWSATTEKKLARALARLPKRKSTKHRRIRLCKTCGADISDRNANARQCSDCEFTAWETSKHGGANHGKA
jgi:transcriptional regulator with XRE-family HTH domain